MGKARGISRTVKVTTGGGRLGARGARNMLNFTGQNEERRKAAEAYSRDTAGLRADYVEALNDLAGGAPASEQEIDTEMYGPTDLPTGFDEHDDDRNDTPAVESFVVDIKDMLQAHRWHGRRRYKDQRTWKRRLRAFDANWAPLMDRLTDAYIKWKYSTPGDVQMNNNVDDASTMDADSFDFTITTIDLHTLVHTATIRRDSNTEASVALAQAGYLGNAPLQPSLAISIKTLELFYIIRLFKASYSVEAFAKVLCYLYQTPYRRGYRTSLSASFDIYLAIRREVDKRVAKELGQDLPNYRVLNNCPPCCYELEEEPPLSWTRMWVVDGNNSLKRMKTIRGRQTADDRIFSDSDYFLPTEFVDTFANEVKSHATFSEDPVYMSAASDSEDDAEESGEGDPTDGSMPSEGLKACTDNWKAARKDSEKRVAGLFEEEGVFASACPHGFILWLCDMVRSGELAKYPLAMVSKALEVFGEQWLLAYDIGCRFGATIGGSSLGPEFHRKRCRTCVNAFHGYAHNAQCQLLHHPLNITGMGLEDLETLERVFASSNYLASITRYMSAYRRRVFMHTYFQQWDSEKYQNLATMLHNNYVQALKIIEEDSQSLADVLASLNITEVDLETYFAEEIQHFQDLGKEAQADLHAVAYVELLQEDRTSQAQYANASSVFHMELPVNYKDLAPEEQYSSHLSSTRKAETQRRVLREKCEHVRLELVKMEVEMGIEHRWEPSHPQYIEALRYMNTRRYQQALESLHKLVVQRLFELHRMNLSQTAYKMRTHIAAALQRRSKAIRAAVRRYNTAALALDPPRATLDWSKVSHYSFLDQFNILQDTRNTVFDKRWAMPVVREAMKTYRRLARAKEEVVRCNIGIRRLHTSIVDEGHHFTDVLKRLENSPLYGPTHEYITRRSRTNTLLMDRIHQTYRLEGFCGIPTPGVRKGRGAISTGVNASHTSDTPVYHSPRTSQPTSPNDDDAHEELDSDGSDDGDDGDDDELAEGVGQVVEFYANLSL